MPLSVRIAEVAVNQFNATHWDWGSKPPPELLQRLNKETKERVLETAKLAEERKKQFDKDEAMLNQYVPGKHIREYLPGGQLGVHHAQGPPKSFRVRNWEGAYTAVHACAVSA